MVTTLLYDLICGGRDWPSTYVLVLSSGSAVDSSAQSADAIHAMWRIHVGLVSIDNDRFRVMWDSCRWHVRDELKKVP